MHIKRGALDQPRQRLTSMHIKRGALDQRDRRRITGGSSLALPSTEGEIEVALAIPVLAVARLGAELELKTGRGLLQRRLPGEIGAVMGPTGEGDDHLVDSVPDDLPSEEPSCFTVGDFVKSFGSGAPIWIVPS